MSEGIPHAERPVAVIFCAIGEFARVTGNVRRIADPVQRRKVLELLADYADVLREQTAEELAELPPAPAPIHHQPEAI